MHCNISAISNWKFEVRASASIFRIKTYGVSFLGRYSLRATQARIKILRASNICRKKKKKTQQNTEEGIEKSRRVRAYPHAGRRDVYAVRPHYTRLG